jgi:hypothetical protein
LQDVLWTIDSEDWADPVLMNNLGFIDYEMGKYGMQ